MMYLLAKYALLFLLAAAFGFMLGYWFSRRNFEDVSESFEDLRKANDRSDAANWTRLWGLLKEIPEPVETDLSRVYESLDDVAGRISRIPEPREPDLGKVYESLHDIASRVSDLPEPKEPDLGKLYDGLDDVAGRISRIPEPRDTDLTQVYARLDAVTEKVSRIPEPVDLKPIETALSGLRAQIEKLPAVETHSPVDLAPVSSRIETLEQRIAALPRTQVVDLDPVEQRLVRIETELGKLGSRVAEQPSVERAAEPASRQEPRILSAALYGKKDDLKMISGVGPKLERLLNRNGVYYFWQVAEWNNRDIDIIDERLDAFKGRIARDDWVSQAKNLRNSPDAARMPADL